MIEISDQEFILLKNYLLDCCGIDIPAEKSYLFKTRLDDLLIEKEYESFQELFNHLKTDKDEKIKKSLIQYMTTNETAFFRDGHPFEAFIKNILPQITQKNKQNTVFLPPQLKIWSAGCSMGQEPFSIAMLVKEWLDKQKEPFWQKITILASDISTEVLKKAILAQYTENEIKKGMKEPYLSKYFSKNGTSWILNEQIKNMVEFREINLAESFETSIGPFDIIFLRNVIIYFSIELKREIIEQIYHILKPQGVLILGASETLYQLSDKFKTHYVGQSIYYEADK